MKNPSDSQLGAAPAAMVKIEQMNRDILKAVLRPITSANTPQNRAPQSMPMYTAMVNPFV